MKKLSDDYACFGVAGNFTGHLEQAKEDKDFVNIKTSVLNAPKGMFPTYIPSSKLNSNLKIFPFDSEKIIFPTGELNLQIEPECGIIFELVWENNLVKDLIPIAFSASNDCSIRKEGAKKISEKKNWGLSSKGVSSNFIDLDSFSENGNINDYKIASFLKRENELFAYGEDSYIKNYSYIYEDLIKWMIEKLNFQKDEGPLENLYELLKLSEYPSKIFVSIGATRYTEFGQNNFLQKGDEAIVVLYPESKISIHEVMEGLKSQNELPSYCSVLREFIDF
jgi:hypothetical protein